MSVESKSFILRRDGDAPLKFSGTEIASVNRTLSEQDEDGEAWITVKTSAKLYRTSSGKHYVVGIARYDETNEVPLQRYAISADSLKAVAKEVDSEGNFDDDVLFELFKGTEVEEDFVLNVD